MPEDVAVSHRALVEALFVASGARPDELDALWAELRTEHLPHIWQGALDRVHRAIEQVRETPR